MMIDTMRELTANELESVSGALLAMGNLSSDFHPGAGSHFYVRILALAWNYFSTGSCPDGVTCS
jgi:hypothetical protein